MNVVCMFSVVEDDSRDLQISLTQRSFYRFTQVCKAQWFHLSIIHSYGHSTLMDVFDWSSYSIRPALLFELCGVRICPWIRESVKSLHP